MTAVCGFDAVDIGHLVGGLDAQMLMRKSFRQVRQSQSISLGAKDGWTTIRRRFESSLPGPRKGSAGRSEEDELQGWAGDQAAEPSNVVIGGQVQVEHGRTLWLQTACLVIDGPGVEALAPQRRCKAPAPGADFKEEMVRFPQQNVHRERMTKTRLV